MNEIVVKEEFLGARADIFLANELNVSRNQVLNLIKEGLVNLNDKPLKKASVKLTSGDKFGLKFSDVQTDEKKEKLKFNAKFDTEFDVPSVKNKIFKIL